MVSQGDIVWLDFDPQLGHEQRGRRPALIVSNDDFHVATNHKMAMVCPITKTAKVFPFRVPLGAETSIKGYIMCEQVKVFDISSRNAEYIEKVSVSILDDVIDVVGGISRR